MSNDQAGSAKGASSRMHFTGAGSRIVSISVFRLRVCATLARPTFPNSLQHPARSPVQVHPRQERRRRRLTWSSCHGTRARPHRNPRETRLLDTSYIGAQNHTIRTLPVSPRRKWSRPVTATPRFSRGKHIITSRGQSQPAECLACHRTSCGCWFRDQVP